MKNLVVDGCINFGVDPTQWPSFTDTVAKLLYSVRKNPKTNEYTKFLSHKVQHKSYGKEEPGQQSGGGG